MPLMRYVCTHCGKEFEEFSDEISSMPECCDSPSWREANDAHVAGYTKPYGSPNKAWDKILKKRKSYDKLNHEMDLDNLDQSFHAAQRKS
jgi:hypothetical protein